MTQEEIEFNDVCGVDPEVDEIPAIVRKREAEKSEADQREADDKFFGKRD